LIVQHGKTSRNQIKAALSALDGVGARLLGTVLSMTPESDSGSYYHYYSRRSKPHWEMNATESIPSGVSGTARDAGLVAAHLNREPVRNGGPKNGLGRLPTERPPETLWNEPPGRVQ
jgi:hypothetical protein